MNPASIVCQHIHNEKHLYNANKKNQSSPPATSPKTNSHNKDQYNKKYFYC